MKVIFSGHTHIGLRRADNQDNIFLDGIGLPPNINNRPFTFEAVKETPVLLAVCDGIGGEEDGEIASSFVVDRLSQTNNMLKSALYDEMRSEVEKVITSTHTDVCNIGKRCGTTIALAIITDEGTHCYNIGDSRIYFLFGRKLNLITRDHTVGCESAANNYSSYYDRRHGGNKLTRCIGIGRHCDIEAYPPIRKGGRMLICSDGLTDMVTDREIESILFHSRTADIASETLIKKALDNGGKDNVSVIVADIPRCKFDKCLTHFIRKM